MTEPRTLVLALVALACFAGPARADNPTPQDRAKQLHDEGLRQYSAGDYPAAIAAYEEAYKLVPAPGILFNLAHAYRLANQCAHALEAYRAYVQAAPDAPNVDVANRHITAMEECVNRARPPEPHVDSISRTTPPPIVRLGEHDADPGRGMRFAGLAVGGVGVGSAMLGLYFGLQARSASTKIDEFFAAGGTWDDAHAQLERDGKRDNLRALAFTIVGAIGVATGGYVYYLGTGGRTSAVSFVPDPHGGQVAWTGAF
ncbi:MAG: hypothetical protein H6Q90_2781 [Deltaproteobacteria bacterium]|nr:hypothetical protein [Deltaproteobacteria bacterium]